MYIVGIDLSLNSTGWAKLEDKKPCEYGVLKPHGKFVAGMPRLSWIRGHVARLAAGADLVVFEQLAFAAHDRNHERAGLAILCRHILWRHEIPYILVAPTTLKKFVAGRGGSAKNPVGKNVVLKEVFRKWNIDTNDDNEADAIVLAHIGAGLLGGPVVRPTAEREVLCTVFKAETNNPVLRSLIPATAQAYFKPLPKSRKKAA